MNNQNSTTNLENLNGAWITLIACLHSDAFQEWIHVVGEMKVSELKECRNIDEIPQLMTPSRNALFIYTV